jgi:predicted esterase
MPATTFAFVLGAWLLGCAPVESVAQSANDQLRAAPELKQLEVADHNPAIVSVPPHAGAPRLLLVAAHGAWDRAEGHCELWQEIVGDRAFVLCPQGRRTDRRMPHEHAAYYYPDHHALNEEVLAAISALEAQYPGRVDTTGAVYAGFSQGAIHGAQVIVLHPQLFPRAALVEGGNGFFKEWSRYAAQRYRAGGGERVLFGCGSPACVRTAERCAGFLRGADVSARVVHAEGAGHSYGAAMQSELAASFEWLVSGDARWAQ